MTTESVKYLIDAEDRATAKIRKTTAEVNKQVGQVKELGGQSKASAELVGSLATSLGGTGVGSFASEVAMLTERVSAFSEVSKAGGAGALAFKAGLVGAAAVLSFKVGEAIGNVIFQTDKWNKKLEEANRLAGQLSDRLDTMSLGRIGGDIDGVIDKGPEAISKRLRIIDRELGGIGLQADSAKRQLREIDESWTIFYGRENQEQRLNSAVKRGIELTNERVRLVRSLQSESSASERSSAVLANLRLDIEKASAKTFIEKTRIEMRERGVENRLMEVAISLALKRKKIDDDRAKAENLAKQKAIENERAIEIAEKKRLKARRDSLRAVIQKERELVSELKRQSADLNSGRSSLPSQTLSAGSSQRLLTGSAGSSFRKTAAVIEAERQTKVQNEQARLQLRMAKALESIEKKQQIIEVIGN